MQNHAMMINWRHVTSRQNEDVGMLDTIGDRINDLLRSRGRADRGMPYTQVELFEMLTGERPGPDGKYYSISTNKSTLNRIMLDKQEPSNDFLFAFCDMFDTDTEWVLRGRALESETSGKFISDEAEQVAAIVNSLPAELRAPLLDGARLLQRLHHNMQQSRIEHAMFLEEIKTLLPEQKRIQAQSILNKINLR